MLRRSITNLMLFYPEQGQARDPSSLGLQFEEVWPEASDGIRTQAWWMPVENPSAVALFFHGNAGTMSNRLELAPLLQRLGLTVFFCEYRGYGASDGKPSESGFFADARAALALARQRTSPDIPIIVVGRSLGGAVAAELGGDPGVAGVVLESTFTGLPEMAGRTGIPFASALVAYRFASLEKVKRLQIPILITHGSRDEIVPFVMGEQLRDAATAAPWVRFQPVVGAAHNDVMVVAGSEYWTAWRAFLEQLHRS